MLISFGSTYYETNEELLSSGFRCAEMFRGVGWQLVTCCHLHRGGSLKIPKCVCVCVCVCVFVCMPRFLAHLIPEARPDTVNIRKQVSY